MNEIRTMLVDLKEGQNKTVRQVEKIADRIVEHEKQPWHDTASLKFQNIDQRLDHLEKPR